MIEFIFLVLFGFIMWGFWIIFSEIFLFLVTSPKYQELLDKQKAKGE